jgi:uncharacterized membrane protein
MNYEKSFESSSETFERCNRRVNVGRLERIGSTIGGGALIGYAIASRTKSGILLGLLGAAFVYRGATGNCQTYRILGLNTAAPGEDSDEIARDVHVEKSITINRPPEELYSFWRSFDNLPRFMPNVESVSDLGGGQSHWVATTPGGKTVEWDAEIYNDIPNELIAWRSLPVSDLTNAGSVNFRPAPGGRGTNVKVTFNYNPPGGKPGALLAKLFGLEPGQIVEQNLRRLKQLFETGVIPTTEGQTSGRDRGSKNAPHKAPAGTLAHEAKGGIG